MARARARGLLLATAESSTGGLIGHRLAAVPGASAVLAGGITAYADDAKVALLGVAAHLLAERGAVSAEVASAMARGARDALGASLALAETGVAGPGASGAKPAGLYYLAAVGPGCELSERALFGGERQDRQWAASEAALRLALVCLDGAPSSAPEPDGSGSS